MLLQGSHVLLTGATGSIGRRLAAELAGRGARLTLVARSAEPLARVADEVGGIAVPGDLTDTAGLGDLVHTVEAGAGPVDVVVHNAAVEALDELVEADLDELVGAVALNLTAPLELTRLLLPGMLARRRGHVVAISSLAGVATFPGLTVYGATKAGLTAAMSGLRAELRGTTIQTMTVELGPVHSEMLGRLAEHPPTASAFRRARQLGVLPEVPPEAVARAVADGMERGRVHVCLPRRAAPLAAMARTPRALVRLALTGISTATSGSAPAPSGDASGRAADPGAAARLSVVRVDHPSTPGAPAARRARGPG